MNFFIVQCDWHIILIQQKRANFNMISVCLLILASSRWSVIKKINSSKQVTKLLLATPLYCLTQLKTAFQQLEIIMRNSIFILRLGHSILSSSDSLSLTIIRKNEPALFTRLKKDLNLILAQVQRPLTGNRASQEKFQQVNSVAKPYFTSLHLSSVHHRINREKKRTTSDFLKLN